MNMRYLRPTLPALALPLLTASALAQATGVAHPEQLDDPVTATPAQTSHYVMPSHPATAAAVPQTATAPQQPGAAVSYPATGPAPQMSYPATDPVTATEASHAPAASGLIVRQPLPATATTADSAPVSYGAVQSASVRPEDPTDGSGDYGIVMSVPTRPHELNEGTVLKARLNQELTTESTRVGAPFTAELLADVGHSGEVLLPTGSVLHGHIAVAHGGKRFTGQATLLLQPESVTLPDGSTYPLRATVSQLEDDTTSRVNDEGMIQPRTHPKTTAGILGFTTGTAAVAGAMIGGGVGAAVGASLGAGVGAYWWLKRDHEETLAAGTTLYFSLDESLQLSPR